MAIYDSRNPSRVPLESEICRKQFAHQAILASTEKSVWSALTGTGLNNVVVQAMNPTAESGHSVVFDRVGSNVNEFIPVTELSLVRVKKRHTSSSPLTMVEFKTHVFNDTKFKGKDIGNLEISEHSQAMMLLANSFQQGKDQMFYDVAQGLFENQGVTHKIDLTGGAFDYNALLDIERKITTSKAEDYDTGDSRKPLEPYQLSNGNPCWLLMMDPFAAHKLKQSPGYQNLMYNADVRGNTNRAISGIFGKIGHLFLQAVPVARSTVRKGHKISIDGVDTETAGLRQYDTTNAVWSGEEGFDVNETLNSRMVVLGANAIQFGLGEGPEYLYQPVQENMGRTSYSALRVVMNAQKTKYKLETEVDYFYNAVHDVDYGVIAVDVRI